jgi:hypothetical protein
LWRLAAAQSEPGAGSILAPVARQAAWLSLEATPFVGHALSLLDRLLGVSSAYAHGLPWGVWLMGADGSDPATATWPAMAAPSGSGDH